jgi:type IV pilus assembly protein PilB
MEIDDNGELTIYEPVGCEKCGNTGYTGRIGIYEILTVTPKIRKMINHRDPADEIQVAAQTEGMHTMRQSASKLVVEGVTSYKEMLRTTFEN